MCKRSPSGLAPPGAYSLQRQPVFRSLWCSPAGIGGCGKMVASSGYELPKGPLTLDTHLRQRSTGCAHIPVPLQSCSEKRKEKILRPEPERAPRSSFSVPSAPSTDQAQPPAQRKEKCINTSGAAHYLRVDTGG